MRLYKFLHETQETIIIYRAMSSEEARDTLTSKQAAFVKRFKWFSPDLNWIKSRVKDGKFNNSKFKQDRYDVILAFTLPKENFDKYFMQINNSKEYMLDLRKSNSVKWLKVEKL